jgi:RimJ/RimL family protein N-acetyltransferase/nitroimidazol reductase NimA-like FMN-containing flavoprotein (pyridoxamine 5'-phosphate oxidase superfamily)
MTTPTDRTTPLRYRDRMSYDRVTVHAILDSAYHCHVSFTVAGEPRVLPMLHARVDDTLYLHGSSGGRLALSAGGGLPVAVAVTQLDALVLARSQFHHSANYRSVVAHGTANLVTGAQLRRRAFAALVEKVVPGRAADSRPPTDREYAQSAVLALPLTEVSARLRTHGVVDEPADAGLPHWAGLVPLATVPGRPQPADGVAVPVPAYLRPDRGPWLDPAVLRGRHVTLEPLDPAHAGDLFAATDDDEVYRHLPWPRPTGPESAAALIRTALDAWQRGDQVPWLQRDARTGEVLGTTSYLSPDPDNRSVEIGATLLGRAWWRTAVNTESKLLLMARAFDTLRCVRVQWRTDLRNVRSQRAIERLGAVREGVLRRHLRRADGSWRDSVVYSMTDAEWPAARTCLTGRLAG